MADGSIRPRLSDTPLAAEHTRLMRRLLARGKTAPERTDDDALDAARWHPTALRLARDNWRRRMVHERQSAAVFSQLVPLLLAADLPLDFATWALRCSMDELRHALLCAEVVVYLGGEAVAHDVEPAPQALPVYPVPAVEQALRHALYASMSETVSVALLTSEREATVEPFIRRVADQLAADEVGHAKLGWSLLRHLAPWLAGDPEARARTAAWVAVALPDLREKMLGAMPLADADDAPPDAEATLADAAGLGFSASVEARVILDEVIAAAVLPGLRGVGLVV